MIITVRSETGKQFAKVAVKTLKKSTKILKKSTGFLRDTNHVFIHPREEFGVTLTDGRILVAQTIESIFTEGTYTSKEELEGAWDVVKIDDKTYQFQKVEKPVQDLYRVIPKNPHFYSGEEFRPAKVLWGVVGLLTRNHGQILDWEICKTLSDYILGSQDIGTANNDSPKNSPVLFYASFYQVLIMPAQVVR